jgi:hypothetical protein
LAPLALGKRMREARLVLMTDVLEHIADDFEIFSSLVAETLPGTFFVVTVPAELALWNRHDESHGHYRRYDRTRLSQVWEGLPIEPLLVSHFNRRLYPLIKGVRLFNRWRGEDRVVGQHGTDLQLPARPINCLLEKTFAGEATTLCRALAGQSQGYSRGVSLVAIMRRTATASTPWPLSIWLEPLSRAPSRGRCVDSISWLAPFTARHRHLPAGVTTNMLADAAGTSSLIRPVTSPACVFTSTTPASES